MLSLPPAVRIFVAKKPADMRKQFDGLAALVIDAIDEDPQSGHLFVFYNKRRDRVKVLWWDRSGYLLLCKRLEQGRFNIFDRADGSRESFEVSASELALLLEGIDLRGARRRPSHEEVSRMRARA
ncbi:MAG: IS66 family insertion sequence element accessory protein TnpB [Myxococcales bacterium]|nr:IS66 family insertion sequence element accessory protein TnpB [Myxococcales bacterium]